MSTPTPQLAAGAPNGTGGQFTVKHQSLPETEIVAASRGSFLFPPSSYGSGGVDAYIRFWEAIPISDETLSNFVIQYRKHVEWLTRRDLVAWAERYDKSEEHVKWLGARARTEAEIVGEYQRHHAAESDRLKLLRKDDFIRSTQARGIAMAARMYICSGSFTEQEQLEIDNHLVKISREAPPETTESLYKRYFVGEMGADAFL